MLEKWYLYQITREYSKVIYFDYSINVFRKSLFSSKIPDDNESNPKLETPNPEDKSLSTQKVPENFPNVPLIAIHSWPLFPKFVKMIEITDPSLINLLRRRIRLGLPYIGVFVKKDPTISNEMVTDLNPK